MDAELSQRQALETALLVRMEQAVQAPMQWGRDDCGLWCADVLHEVLGYDPAAYLRGRYHTRIGAHRVLGRGGLPAALRKTARRHGWRRTRPDAAEAGDIGVLAAGGAFSTVICRAPGWFVGRSQEGWTALPASLVKLAWRVLP